MINPESFVENYIKSQVLIFPLDAVLVFKMFKN